MIFCCGVRSYIAHRALPIAISLTITLVSCTSVSFVFVRKEAFRLPAPEFSGSPNSVNDSVKVNRRH